jgi:hypothetical protein
MFINDESLRVLMVCVLLSNQAVGRAVSGTAIESVFISSLLRALAKQCKQDRLP